MEESNGNKRTGVKERKAPYLANKDLLIIAVLSGIGGVMSTYVGYLANLLNRLFGVPFGAGQFVGGLHIFWLILVAGLVRKPGSATVAGLLKGIVEFLTGGSHGVVIILISTIQGLLVDVVLLLGKRHSHFVYALAGGISAASTVFVFQLLYFSGAPLYYILFIAMLAFGSGILLAGSFGHSILSVLVEAKPFRMAVPAGRELTGGAGRKMRMVVSGLLFLVLMGGAVYYYSAIYEVPWTGPVCRVEGQVENTLSFRLSSYSAHETTISAELRGEVTYIPEQEYSGIPVPVILKDAGPLPAARTLRVIAADGYQVEFPLADVRTDDRLLLTQENNTLRLVAANYEGAYWVKQVTRFQVE